MNQTISLTLTGRPFWVQGGLPALVGRTSGTLLFLMIAAGALFDHVIFRSLGGAAVLAGLLGANALITPYALTWTKLDVFRGATLGFVAVGLTALFLSILHVYPENPLLPVEDGFILRHSYFVLFWLPVLLGSVHIWSQSLGQAIRFSRKWGFAFVFVVMVVDLATSRLLADQTRDSVGYVFYMEKVSTAFLVTTVYMLHITFGGRRLPAVALITVYFALSQILGLGIMFNASTGQFIYGALMAASILPVSRHHRSWLVIGAYLSLMAVLAYGLFAPESFAFDLNIYLRLTWWRDNLSSLWNSTLLGVGFGTPYFPMTGESLATAQRLAESAPQFEWAFWDPLDALYIRAQHSSLVNLFYRLGVLGGVLFVTLNVALFAGLLKAIRGPDPFVSKIGFVATILGVINLFQISMHVGLETPRFLLAYMLTMALGCLCIEMQRFTGPLAESAAAASDQPEA